MKQSNPMLTTDPLKAAPLFSAPATEIAPGVLMCAQFSNTYAVKTDGGLLLIDPGTARGADAMFASVRAWTDQPLHTAVYTHGHIDHAFGLKPFLAAGEQPHIIAQENCPARFRRYALTNGLNQNVNRRQFGNPRMTFPKAFDWPTLTFRDALWQRIGTTDVRFVAGKGETDDHCYIWLPQQRYLFTGDFVIWRAPNCGNPQKVQRYPVEWADALEQMAALNAEWLFPGHGLAIQGCDAVRMVLLDAARYLRHIVDQVLTRMNAGETPEDIFHAVTSDPELAARPYLREFYDHPKFIVRNLLRLWGGWWNGNPAELMPANLADQGRVICELAGGIAPLITKARAMLAADDLPMATHLVEWAARAYPLDREVLALKRDVYAARLARSTILMEQGIYRAALNDALVSLGEEPVIRSVPNAAQLL